MTNYYWETQRDAEAQARRLERRRELQRQLDNAPLSALDAAHIDDIASGPRATPKTADDLARVEVRPSDTPPVEPTRKPTKRRQTKKEAKQAAEDVFASTLLAPRPVYWPIFTTRERTPADFPQPKPRKRQKMAKDLTQMPTDKLFKRIEGAVAELQRRFVPVGDVLPRTQRVAPGIRVQADTYGEEPSPEDAEAAAEACLLYTSPSPRD